MDYSDAIIRLIKSLYTVYRTVGMMIDLSNAAKHLHFAIVESMLANVSSYAVAERLRALKC